jgi:purine-binding chemotaxis protein CheW
VPNVATAARTLGGSTDASASQRQGRQYLVISLGKQRYATPLEQIREVVDTKPSLPIPNALPYVDGIVDLRGQILSVLDLSKIIDETSSGTVNRATIVVETENGLIGLSVEDLHEVVTLQPNQIMLEGTQTGEGRLSTVGMVRLDGHLVTLLDLSDLVTRMPVLSA